MEICAARRHYPLRVTESGVNELVMSHGNLLLLNNFGDVLVKVVNSTINRNKF